MSPLATIKNGSQDSRTLGVIVGNRDVFPDRLAYEGGKEVIKTLKELGLNIVTLFFRGFWRGHITN